MTQESCELLMTLPEAAKRLRVNKRTVGRLIQQGELRALRVGHQLRVPLAALDELQTRPPRSKETAPATRPA